MRLVSSQTMHVTLRADGFREDWPIQQPGEIVTLLFVPPGEPIVLPCRDWTFPAGAPPQEWRNYTVRRHRPACGEIDVDAVLHEPPGPACTWAVKAPLGAEVGYAGPRVDFSPREGVDWLLLCGDETALPAIAAILEQTPAEQRAVAVVEIPDAGSQTSIDLPPAARLHWVDRDGAPPATTTHLQEALREVPYRRAPARPGEPPSHASREASGPWCATNAACPGRTRAPADTGCARRLARRGGVRGGHRPYAPRCRAWRLCARELDPQTQGATQEPGMDAGPTVAVLLTCALLVGCGGGEAQPTPDQRAATATPSATEAPQASAGPEAVAIAGFEYEPAALTVPPGTKVTWTNEDASNHTVTFEKGPGDLGNVDEGKRLSATFDEKGSNAYVCQYHPNMKGKITVR